MQKDKALEMALGQIEKQYGKGAIMLMGDAASRIQVSVIPTGCIELDAALGVGGVPRGRIVEIYRAGILRQNHHCAAYHCRSAKNGRYVRFYRC